MNWNHRVPIAAFIFTALMVTTVDAQRVGGGDRRPDRARPIGPSTLPAVETYAPGSSGIFEVISVQASNRIVRLRASDGKTGDVSVAEHVYDLSKLKAGDKLKVDFLLADEANPKLSAAGIWPAE